MNTLTNKCTNLFKIYVENNKKNILFNIKFIDRCHFCINNVEHLVQGFQLKEKLFIPIKIEEIDIKNYPYKLINYIANNANNLFSNIVENINNITKERNKNKIEQEIYVYTLQPVFISNGCEMAVDKAIYSTVIGFIIRMKAINNIKNKDEYSFQQS